MVTGLGGCAVSGRAPSQAPTPAPPNMVSHGFKKTIYFTEGYFQKCRNNFSLLSCVFMSWGIWPFSFSFSLTFSFLKCDR